MRQRNRRRRCPEARVRQLAADQDMMDALRYWVDTQLNSAVVTTWGSPAAGFFGKGLQVQVVAVNGTNPRAVFLQASCS